MSKVISVRLSEAEELRLRDAAAVAGMPLSGYLKWLMSQGRTQSDTELTCAGSTYSASPSPT